MVSKIRMTADEFFQLPETNQPTELIDGELTVSPSPVFQHQFVSGELFTLLKKLVPNGVVLYAPMDVHFDEINVLQLEQYLEVYILKNGAYVSQGVYGPDDSFQSPVLGGKTVELKGIFGD